MKNSDVSQVLARARDWSDLRASPHGLAPALVMGFISFFQVFDSSAFIIAGPDIIREFDIDVIDLVRISQFVGFFAVILGLWLAWMTDRVRRLPFYVGGTIGSGVFSMLSAFAHTTFTLGLPRTLDDVSNRAADIPSFSLLADYYPSEVRGRVFALHGLLGSTATLLALPLAGAGITYLGLRTSFVVFGAPIAIMGVIAGLILKEPIRGYFERREMGADEDVAAVEDEPRSFGEAMRTTWSVRTLRRMFFASMIGFFGVTAYGTFYALFVFERYGLDAFQRGLIGLPAVVATMIGGFLGGGMIDTFNQGNPRRVLTVFGAYMTVASLAMVGIAFGPPLWLLAVLSATFGFGTALIGPAFYAVMSQVIPPDIRTQGMQVFGLAVLPSLLIGLGIFVSIFERYGYTTTFLAGAPFLVAGALIVMSAGPFFDLDRRNALAAAAAGEEWRRTRAAGEGKLLVCRGVDVAYGGVQVLFGVDFDVEEGEVIALLGTNGAGKSTLLRAISGTQEAAGGAIVFDGRDITHMPPHEIARRQVIHMPGGRGVFPGLTVDDNLKLGTWMLDDHERGPRLAEVRDIFPVLVERAGTPAVALSGGEQQQLSLAQAFLANPRLLMIDELSMGLAPAVVAELLDRVREIHARGTTIIIVEQSVNVALALASRAIFMEKGEVRFFGPTQQLLDRPDILRSVYVKGTATLGAAREVAMPEHRAVALSVVDVTRRYGGVTALDGVSLDVEEGAALGIIGPNGSGKTTLFDVISGFQPADQGKVLLAGRDLTDLGPAERSRLRLVRRFQDARLFPSLTVHETLLVTLDRHLDVTAAVLNASKVPAARRSEARIRERADRLIGLLELGAFRDKFVRELSTGVRRIVDLACMLALEPLVLLLDEPSTGIAQKESEGLAPLLARVRRETGCTLLIIEHDMTLLTRVVDDVLVLDRGRVLTRGAPAAVLDDERVVEAYLGSAAGRAAP